MHAEGRSFGDKAMRISPRVLLLVALAVAVHLTATVSQATAADLGVTQVKKKVVRTTHKRSRVVADYDGTPVVFRPSGKPVLVGGPYGAPVQIGLLQAQYVPGAVPTRYLNGERIPV